MKFVKVFALLLLFSMAARGQEDFIEEPQNTIPQTNGLFEEELEPIVNDAEITRPQTPPPSAQKETPSRNINFPEAKKVTTTGGRSLSSIPQTAELPNKSEKVRLDFVQVEIEDIVKYFAERLRKKFIYDPSVLSGKVTIISPSEVTMQEAYGAFLSAMEVRGYVMYPAGAYIKIEKAANARKVPVPVYEGTTPNDDSYVTRILTLKYLLVRDVSQAVRNLLSRTGGDLIEHAPTNTLIISDYAYNIRRIVRILDVLDVESFQEQVEIIPLRNAAAPDIARKVTDFFPTTGSGGGAGGNPPAGRLSRRTGAGAESDNGVIQKVVADERTNSIIILGSERGIEQVKKFIARIDIPTEGGGGQIHVYPVQNVKAEELSATLSSLTTGLKKSTPTMLPVPTMPGMPTGVSASPEVANLGDVKITADKATNALVIQASPRDFEILKTIIRKLDIRRRQVFLEGAILEASLDKTFNWNPSVSGPLAKMNALKGGTEADPVKSGVVGSLNGFGFDGLLQSALTNPAALTGMALGFRSGGTYKVSYTDKNGASQTANLPLLSAIVQLSAKNGNVNILSTPHILATANEEATLSIGDEIPQSGGSTQTASGFSQTNIVRLKVATELSITPQINQGDYLTLKIKEKINDTKSVDKDGNVSTVNREASTTVIVKDQQTVVIGGLMRDKTTESVTKVPILGDIPILGWFFKSKNSSADKVNLLLFLTPYIIKNTGDMNDQFFRKLKEREGFLKQIGVKEKDGIPAAGLTEEQLQMLDKDYVKSLEKKFVYPKAQSQENDAELKPETEQSSKAKTPTTPEAPAQISAPTHEETKELTPAAQPIEQMTTPEPTIAPIPVPLPDSEPIKVAPMPPQAPAQIAPPPVTGAPQIEVINPEPLPKELELEDTPPERAPR